ncbi:Inositol monophosphatase/fructose-1,6-bisphosphatase family protein (plasmid) [Neorhizobium galegae bv. officinalis bv. officinalis str. HAMBI 1141]|jgi:myo-inositol-1(or 4)-monophosphatase|uniref:Inositol monophosphatase/fructose-1,6-bisphosphatase family protein n=1 Tax=Neorhizobium galegae bv. officinalis bv. officinalis str. HAMBI 1141 TaxID=1028801 RepID=A0A068TKQ9_NEOGA|nr:MULTISPECIES: inositol monophosphatase [Neorhizobium]MCJ9672257.1 inositol monophosphatase [Neorhizobium sp. SHOUNA12B]MCJ9748101.1 inositol monophosphatase [Neorhizobium sp. SHOUNA12A]MCJ9751248.1 inositol monophosphatase [Neorhizobium sp. BETTINA12A]CDN58175.1 Inositol monophosphatase/fructose-1,6-bisphosphatase family protein [Neorhizobium galegae bv. officinalis bv. officinalis str. HAMBI 1141]
MTSLQKASDDFPETREQRVAEAKRLMAVAMMAASAVQAPLMAAFRSDMEIGYKRDLHDVVTVHDKNAETTIRNIILDNEPNSAILGEEGGQIGDGDIQWYVDPIDGTANFASGFAFWCVSIAAVRDGTLMAGVVFDPVANALFSADLEHSYLNGRLIQSKAADDERRATLITGYPVSRDFHLDGRDIALAHLGDLVDTFSTVRRPGSAALSIAHVAAGFIDAAAGFGVNAWDVAAAILILKNAGGRYEPMTLGKVPPGSADFMCPGYVATGNGGDYPTLNRIAREISNARNGKVSGSNGAA